MEIDINLSYVSNNYAPNRSANFTTTKIVKTDSRGKGLHSITAQVQIPSNLPLYGSSSLRGFPINVQISENATENPLSFIAVMAHELTHIVLHSIWHPKKDDEYYTDLAAMMLGFVKVIRKGRKYTVSVLNGSTTITYGYLDDSQFTHAEKEVTAIIEKQENWKGLILAKVAQAESIIENGEKNLILFQQRIDYLDSHLPKKISVSDGKKVSSYHQSGYLEKYSIPLLQTKENIKRLEKNAEQFTHFNNNSQAAFNSAYAEVTGIIAALKPLSSDLSADIQTLNKYCLNYREKILSFLQFPSSLAKKARAWPFLRKRKFSIRRIRSNSKLIPLGIIAIVIFWFAYAYFSDKAPSNSSNGVAVGKYWCSYSDASQADSLDPTTNNKTRVDEAKQTMDALEAELNSAKAQVDTTVVDNYDQTSVDAYNELVQSYNSSLSKYQEKQSQYNQVITDYNARIKIYNDFLVRNCTPR